MASRLIDKTFRHQSGELTEERQNEKGCISSHGGCVKNVTMGLSNFISVSEFQKEHLPILCRSNTDFMEYVRNAIDKTVRVKTSFTSNNRPDTFANSEVPYPFIDYRGSTKVTRCGTGYLEEFCDDKESSVPCLCKLCQKSEQAMKKCWIFIISTSSHLIWDGEEAESAVFELDYNTEDRQTVKYLYGTGVLGEKHERYLTDYCKVTCVTHDEELGNNLKYFCGKTAKIIQPHDFGDWNTSTGILISHPHGFCKKISVGNIHHRCLLRHPRAMSVKLRKGRYCRLPIDNNDPETMQIWRQGKNDNSESDFQNNEIEKVTNEANFSISSLLRKRKILEKSLLGDDLAQLAIDVKVILPEMASHHMRRCIKDDSMHWYVFPPDTKFISPEGTIIPFPSNMEFHMPNVYAAYTDDHRCNSWYVTYDMASRPGSSGARVLDLFRHNQHQPFHHFGSYPDHNESGLIRGYYFVPDISDSDLDLDVDDQ